ncbi:MAG: zinc ribbon domain-containing protein, partial [Candidatus Altiarchaeota archaeon]
MNCPTCQEKIQNKKYIFCPMCGSKLNGIDGEYNPDRLKYLLRQDEAGLFIHDNFTSVRHAGTRQWTDVINIRRIGDFSHLYLNNLHVFSLLTLQPKCAIDLYRMGKLVGRGTIGIAMKVIGTEKLINSMIRTGMFWKIFEFDSIQKNFL